MLAIINLLYFLLILMYIITSFFIIYHLVKYSIHSSLNYAALILFIAVSAPLLIINIVLFSMVNWTVIIGNLLP